MKRHLRLFLLYFVQYTKVRLAYRADFFIAFTKDDCQKALPGREIYRVERMGVLLSIVLDRRSYLATASAQAPATVK